MYIAYPPLRRHNKVILMRSDKINFAHKYIPYGNNKGNG